MTQFAERKQRGQVFPAYFCATKYYFSFNSKSQLLVS